MGTTNGTTGKDDNMETTEDKNTDDNMGATTGTTGNDDNMEAANGTTGNDVNMEAANGTTGNDLTSKQTHSQSIQDGQIAGPFHNFKGFVVYKKTFRPTPVVEANKIKLSNYYNPLAIQNSSNLSNSSESEPTTNETDETSTTTNRTNTTTTNRTNTTTTPTRPNIGQFKIDLDSIFCPNELTKDLMTHCNGHMTAKCTRQELVITPKTVPAHNKIRERLDTIRTTDIRDNYFRHVAYHFYRATDETRLKIVLKGLPAGYPIDNIKEHLTALKVTYFQVTEMMKRTEDGQMTPLGIYIIEIPRRDMTSTKQTIKYIGHYSIKIEDYKQTDRVPQCKNCYKLYHTRTYCRRPTVCALCTGNHATETCNAHMNDSFVPKCNNCDQNHAAFDPVCKYITDARTLRQQQLNKTTQDSTQNTTNSIDLSTQNFPNLAHSSRTYSSMISNTPPPTNPPPTSQTLQTTSTADSLKDLMTLLKSCDLKKLLTAITPIVEILKGPGDILSKLILSAIKLVEIFN